MSDSKSQDHWNALALLLDVAVPDEPAEESVAEEEQPVMNVTEEPEAELSAQADADQPPSAEEQPVVAKPRRKTQPAAPRANKKHWLELAQDLGIEVPFEEAEEEVEPAAAEPVTEEPVTMEPIAAELVAVEPIAAEGADAESIVVASAAVEPTEVEPAEPEASEATDDSAGEWPESELPTVEVEFDNESRFEPSPPEDQPVSLPPSAPPARKVPSLFDDANFSIDTPGALDRIFDEDAYEETRPAMPAGFEERDAYAEFDGDLDSEGDLALLDEDEEVEDELTVTAPSGSEAEAGEADAEAEGEEPRRRRRRRRRRRKPVKEGGDELAAAEGATDDQQPAELAGAEAPGEATESASHEEGDEHDEDHHDGDEDDDEFATLGVKHRKIPTWDEAVQVVISANMESRAKNPSGGPRGRGRGRGRRP